MYSYSIFLSILIILCVGNVCYSLESSLNQLCAKRFFENQDSFVCVCNSTYCDEQQVLEPLTGEFAYVVKSDKFEHRFKVEQVPFEPYFVDVSDLNVDANRNVFEKEKENEKTSSKQYIAEKERIVFKLRRSTEFQTVLGFGGAFTDAAGRNFAKLDPNAQDLLLRSYYGRTGLDYNLGRINMGGCDFSTRPYTYCDTEDPSLETFALQEDDILYKIPYVKEAKLLAESEDSDTSLKLFASPWSAPAWMKTNNNITGRGFLRDEYYQTWADYFIRFLDEYRSQGVEMWGLTAQNEPNDGRVPEFSFNCMGWTAAQQRHWVAHYLGPALEESGYFGKVKLMILDGQRPNAPRWTKEVFEGDVEEGKLAKKYVDGVALHWYIDNIPILGDPSALDKTHEQFPDKFLLYTEACNGDKPWDEEKVKLGDWKRGEKYMHNIIEDLNHWVVGWVDWNLALDMEGGPNWAGNFVDSPVIVNEASGEFYKQPMYYALGHISRFVRENSKRIDMELISDTPLSTALEDKESKLDRVAFTRPADEATVIVLQNRNPNSVTKITIRDEEGNRQLNVDLGPKSFATVLFW